MELEFWASRPSHDGQWTDWTSFFLFLGASIYLQYVLRRLLRRRGLFRVCPDDLRHDEASKTATVQSLFAFVTCCNSTLIIHTYIL